MHEWHSEKSSNYLSLERCFTGYTYQTDYTDTVSEVKGVKFQNKFFKTESEARMYITSCSYGSDYAYMALVKHNDYKITKSWQTAFDLFIKKQQEYKSFYKNLDMTYGRNSKVVGCPTCGSSFNSGYLRGVKACPICHSKKVISQTNWDTLKKKETGMEEACKKLELENEKLGIYFLCGFEWHC